MIICAGSINRDHVHLLIGIPPNVSVSRAVQFLKGKNSHKLLSEFRALRKRYWGQRLWARGYWVASSGNVTDEVWKEYIKKQPPPEYSLGLHNLCEFGPQVVLNKCGMICILLILNT